MWYSVMKLIQSLSKRRTKILCAKKNLKNICKKGYIHLNANNINLIDSIVYMATEEEFSVLQRKVESLNVMMRFFTELMNAGNGRKMFTIVSETWNPVTGCLHNCVYCWARRLALTRLRHSPRYRDGFRPRMNPEEFKKQFKGGVVFVSDMGDLWGEWVSGEWIHRVLSHIRRFPNTWFLFLTKNPQRYHDFLDEMPSNVILGATIETNRDIYFQENSRLRISLAPPPSHRYKAMKDLDWPLKFISIEPILDFDIDEFIKWIEEIDPFMIYIGYDNYGNKLPEPPLSKTLELIKRLENITLVLRKTIRPAWNEKQRNIRKAHDY